jgi:hypothetical protein
MLVSAPFRRTKPLDALTGAPTSLILNLNGGLKEGGAGRGVFFKSFVLFKPAA